MLSLFHFAIKKNKEDKKQTTMDSYEETFETWNKIALLYQNKFMDLDIYDKTYDFICDNISKKGAHLLEIGCGPGNITKYLLNKRPDYKIFGIDIAPRMIELAKQNNPTANFATMDSRQIDLITLKFDGVVCGFCLPYLSYLDSKKLIADCNILLRENGLFYISFVEGDAINSGFQIGSSGERSYFYYHNLNEIKSQLIANNFDSILVFKVNYKKSQTENEIHTIVTAKKKPMDQLS